MFLWATYPHSLGMATDHSLILYLTAFEDTLHHPDLTVEMALATVRLAAQHNR